jgi:ABC-type dipeptide/oligopeptide/nickel transport system ATPase component
VSATTSSKTTTAKPTVKQSLNVADLRVSYRIHGQLHQAVKGVSFTLAPGEVLGLVGESGSGKSSIAHAVLQLLPDSARIEGKIELGSTNLVRLSERQLTKVRGRQIGMVFQDPSASLNPVFKIGTQIVDTLRNFDHKLSRSQAKQLAGQAIEEMGISASRLGSYPHQLSGGMRQRALIAAAMAGQPDLMVADEPTSDLDTVSQAQILKLLRRLRDEKNIGILLISHDMGVIASICDRVGVMQGGHLVELGRTGDVLRNPQHPYSRALIQVSRRERDATGRFITMPNSLETHQIPRDEL